MELGNNTVLVTGGGSGIGLALATRFLKSGSKVIICGRRSAVLAKAANDHPGLLTIQCDVAGPQERTRLFEEATRDYPDINVLVNNAGIQNRPPPMLEQQDWTAHTQELSINLHAPMHLTMLFAPFLKGKKNAAIINITSGLAFVPIAMVPTYCATKAAMHSFSLSTRRQLRDAGIKVFEVAPPGVQTDLGGKGLHDWGVPLDEFADYAMTKIAEDSEQFGYQFSEQGMNASPEQQKEIFERMNSGAR